MRGQSVAFELWPAGEVEPGVETRRDPKLGDVRFRALMPEAEWLALPAAIRRRFGTRLPGGGTTVYAGEVLETRMSRLGWCLAQALRAIGGPLPTARCVHAPSVVTVTEDKAGGGQFWTRIYARRKGFPQVVHSSKRFAGPSGLEEYVGYGIGMTLSVHECDCALVFRSRRYFLQLFGRRLFLPRWMTPGLLTVIHAEVPDGKFAFTLQIEHPRFGLLLRQMALYRELAP